MIYQRKAETVEALLHEGGPEFSAPIKTLIDDVSKEEQLAAEAEEGDYIVKNGDDVYLARGDIFEQLYEEAP